MILLVSSAAAQDWPQFRGPSGDGICQASGLPTEWSLTKNIRWRTPTPGRGRSSPVIVGDRIWMTSADESPASPEAALRKLADHPDPTQVFVCRSVKLKAICLHRASGKLLHEIELSKVDSPDPIHRLNSFATPTPVAAGQWVWCDFGTYGTVCLDAASGEVLWRARLPVEHVLGPGSSPVVCGDLLVLVRDGADRQYVAALDKRTGKTAWRTDRPAMAVESRHEKKSFSTPLVVSLPKNANAVEAPTPRRPSQVVVPGTQWVCAYDPADGREIWRVRHGKGYSLAPRPIYSEGLVYVCTGCYNAELWAIRIDGQGDVTETHVAWKAKGQIPLISSPILVGDAIYCVSDAGVVSSFDARNGRLRWRDRLGGNYCASPLYADGKLHFFEWEGKTSVLKPGPTFVRLAENQLEGPLVATPAIVGNAIYLRTDRHLYCVGMTKVEERMRKDEIQISKE